MLKIMQSENEKGRNMENVPYIAFDAREYDDLDDMWYDVRSVIAVLVKNNYEVLIRYEDAGIYILEYSSTHQDLGTPVAYWLSPDDYYDYLCSKENDSEEDMK